MDKSEDFQIAEETKSKLVEKFFPAIGGIGSDNAHMYEEISVYWHDYTRAAMKEMYIRCAEDREKMLEI